MKEGCGEEYASGSSLYSNLYQEPEPNVAWMYSISCGLFFFPFTAFWLDAYLNSRESARGPRRGKSRRRTKGTGARPWYHRIWGHLVAVAAAHVIVALVFRGLDGPESVVLSRKRRSLFSSAPASC